MLFLHISSQFHVFVQCLYHQKDLLNGFQKYLTDIDKASEIAIEYSKNWSYNEPVILAVDACSLNPAVSLFSNGSITGLIHEYQMDKELLSQASTTISVFEKWISNHSKTIVDSYFVFQVQPLRPNLNSFILHIEPSKGGNANNQTLFILKKLAKILQKVKITVVSFSSDGDDFASASHDNNIKKHYKKFQYNCSPNTTEPLFLSDPLHIFKRVRYHFIPIITEQNQIRSILNLPAIVFRNDRASKMHDKLPLLFFQLKNYETLNNYKFYNYSIFILPYCLLLSFLSYDISYETRLLFLNMARILIEKVHFPFHFTYFQNQINFTPNIIRDFLSTVLRLLDILNLSNLSDIHLNRLGTNPLEHAIGIIRIRSKDHHNSERFIKEAGKINALINLNEELILENIKNRDLKSGKVISIPQKNKYDDLKAKIYVDSLYQEIINGNCDKKCNEIHSLFNEVINGTIGTTKKCYLLSSKDIMLAPNSNILIEKRQNAANELSPKCNWNNQEVSLLLKLNRDLN
ncbi:hypothetical protein M9Y10_036220 [Tritrichomonas musculus]|uniref:Uncharacterized protein n=1 Tax=Tritrichomonas musculus TaxID=1915356 RepID=A0ABR2GUT7_9EUKA